MKKNRDFFSDDLPFFEDQSDLDRDIEGEETLPEVFCASSLKSENKESKVLAAFQFFLPFVIMITAAVLAFVILLIATGRGGGRATEPVFSPEVEEWRGAFHSHKIYEECMECSVSLRVGKGDNAKEWSGVIISPDGWIATSENMMLDSDEGRIYAKLSDGREYSVGSFFKSEDGAALKIDAGGLEAAALSDGRELQSGERVIAISAGEDVICGFVSSVDECLRLNMICDKDSEGAPVFDTRGYLVGIVCSNEAENTVTTGHSVKKIEKIIEKIKIK